MPRPFIHRADVINTIRNILEHYPLVDGPIREILQNSDDAGATRQIFILDYRSHPTSFLVSPEYAQHQQVPSLIAINDAQFNERDWNSLQTIFDSSKAQDPMAVGQFGQGFRCVYHLTDCPQIFSGHTLALLDLPEGITLDMTNSEDAKNTGHLAAFQGLPGISYSGDFPSSAGSQSTTSTFPPPPTASSPPYVDGTIIRLPLRRPHSHKPSSPSMESRTPNDILKLFEDFIKYDLECVLLFLKNIKEIAVYELNTQGLVREICSAVLRKGEESGSGGGDYVTWRCVVETRVSTLSPPVPPTSTLAPTSIRPTGGVGVGAQGIGKSITKSTTTIWRILSCPFTDQQSVEILNRIPEDCNPGEQMKWRKLNQSIRVAAPLSCVTSSSSSSTPAFVSVPGTKSFSALATSVDVNSTHGTTSGARFWRHGRLFHGLPLPRSNNQNWPIHVDAKFALPPSRQRVRSFHESGFIGEWNMRLFGAFIPQAWTFLLLVLARDDKVVDIFEYWPPPGGPTEFNSPVGIGISARAGRGTMGAASGNGTSALTGRSQGMLETVFDFVVIAKPAVWPVYVPAVSPTSPSQSTTSPRSGLSSPGMGNANLSTPQPPPEFAELGNLKVALDEVHYLDLRNSLAECGIKFTKPPGHFKSLIENCQLRQFHFLGPENVRKELLEDVSRLEQAIASTPKHANAILEFLIKDGDVQLLVGLPLLRNVDGHYITLRKLALPGSIDASKQTLHTLLDPWSAPLFKNCDSNAIALNELSRSVAMPLAEKGPGNVNVVKLNLEKVIEYLSSDPRWSSDSSPSPVTSPMTTFATSLTPLESTQWLGKFYQWLSTQPYASDFFQKPEVKGLYIIPTQVGLKRVVDPVFDTMSATVLRCLRALGIGLLDPSIGMAAKQFLGGVGDVLRKNGDVEGILDGVMVGVLGGTTVAGATSALTTTSLGLSCLEWKPLVEYLVRHTHVDQLSEVQKRKLRLLPIYPLLDPFDTTHTPRPDAIPDNKIVYGVTFVDLLPILDGSVYLDLRGYSVTLHGILHLLSLGLVKEERPLTNNDLLDLGVRNFGSQPPEIKSSIVMYVVKYEKSVPREMLERLWETALIVCQDGSVRKPGEVIDTSSTVGLGAILSLCAGMSDGDDERDFEDCLPRMESEEDRKIMEGLKKLSSSPLRTELDEALLVRITGWISKNVHQTAAVEASRKLLKFLAANPGHGKLVGAIPINHKWIPTDAGLKARHECRDRSTQSLLFDEVYALVEDGMQVTDVLKTALGWTEKLSHDNLFDQLDATLRKGGECNKVREIIKVIGSEKVTPVDLEKLRGILEGREWVPTTVANLVKPEDAVLGHVDEGTGFFQVSFSEAMYPNVIAFLKCMGVREKPTPDMILARIEEVGRDSLTFEQVDRVVKLLECLPADLEDGLRERLLVPDSTRTVRPVTELHFNDTGSRQEHLPPSIMFLAHPNITESLARTLDIKPLASTLSTFSESGYMGESFITSVRKALTDYNETQMIPEMLANAVDARASRFVLVLDEMPTDTENLISPNFGAFQCPALLVYNDGEFTEEDLRGLCRTGEGSKANKRDSIGQFGRGALTMFHITEFPMLVSSTHALFIDPSREHLQGLPPGANNQRMELQTLRDFYPNQLGFLRGLKDCLGLPSEDTAEFSGTMFRLPLRQMSHIQHGSSVSQELWETSDVEDRILSKFKAIASSCLLFTDLESIQVFSRSRDGVLQELWNVLAVPQVRVPDGAFSRRMVQIQADDESLKLWQTVSYPVPRDVIPHFASMLIDQMKLRNPMVELAACIRPESADHDDYHGKSALFSTLPLTEETDLPVHCSATFIMTSDRRHIRLQVDDDPGKQAEYNVWLLKDIVPVVYLYLLEHLTTIDGAPNQYFWPINNRLPIDRLVMPSLYENHLRTSTRRLFQCAYAAQRHLTPQEVLILPEGFVVEPVIDFLEPRTVTKCREPFLSCVTDDAELQAVSPAILRELILASHERLMQAFLPSPAGDDPVLPTEVLKNLLNFFIEEGPEYLFGLPLLPLEDNTLGIFAPSSSPPTFYVWSLPILPDVILANPSRLVCLSFDSDMFLDKGFNIEKLNSASIASLMEEAFPKQAFIEATEEESQFISQFWDNFHLLELNKEDILDFPLVPTLIPGRFISLESCKDGRIPIVPISVEEFVCQCFSSLGVPLVRKSAPHCHPSLAHIFEEDKSDFPDFKFRDILRSLKEIDRSLLLARFSGLDMMGNLAPFADWARRILFQDVPSSLRDIARALPVWMSQNTHDYVPAEQLVVLPQGLDEAAVVPYITRYNIPEIPADQSQILRAALENLGVQRVSYGHLFAVLRHNLPPTMPDPAERERYKRLVESILEHIYGGGDGLEELRLPNAADFTLRPVQELFSKTEPLFDNALEADDPSFPSPEFEELESRLPLKKLEDIDMRIFAHCLQSIANKTGEERRSCGRVALDVLNDRLPLILSLLGPGAHRWELIDGVNFIPERTEPLWRPGVGTEDDLDDVSLNVSQYVERQFGDLVAPQDILREEYVGVAWSQRCLPVVPLSESLIRAFPAIGRPSVDDVVAHLRVLVRIAHDHPNHLAILPDIIATYKFLDEKADNSPQLSVLREERLFLNVDQTSEDWEWEAAVNLSFDVRDVGHFKSVRRFLHKYKNLLIAAGAQEVNHPRIASAVDTDHDLGHDRVRRKFNEMRRRRKLVDVEFIARDYDADRPLLGHRSFLAAASDHLMDMFCSEFSEGLTASVDNPVQVPMTDFSRDSVSLILDYIYGTASEPPPVSILLEGTALAEYWRMEDLAENIKGRIIGLVNPETIDDISRVAEERGWTTVTEFCDEYRSNNLAYIEGFRLEQRP